MGDVKYPASARLQLGWKVHVPSNVIQECASTMYRCAMFSCYIALYGNADLLIGYLLIAVHRVTNQNQAFTIKCKVVQI